MGKNFSVVFLTAVLVLPASAATAQYWGTFQRDYGGRNCPPSTAYRGGSCVTPSPERSTSGSDDWRKQRDRQLEDRARTDYDRERDRDNWRVQRQRELDDRFGKADQSPSRTQDQSTARIQPNDQLTRDRAERGDTAGSVAAEPRLDNKPPKPPKPDDCIIRPPRPGVPEAPRPASCQR
jgi:hypothetical protein